MIDLNFNNFLFYENCPTVQYVITYIITWNTTHACMQHFSSDLPVFQELFCYNWYQVWVGI